MSGFSSSRTAYKLTPFAHLIYTVLCDTVALSGDDGLLPVATVDDAEYLARLCNMKLLTDEQMDKLFVRGQSGTVRDYPVLSGTVTTRIMLARARNECIELGLFHRVEISGDAFYEFTGFTDENPAFLNPETLRKKNYRKNKGLEESTLSELSVDSPGQSGTVRDGPGLSRLEEKRREEKRKEDPVASENEATLQTAKAAPKEKKTRNRLSPEEAARRKSLITALEALFSRFMGSPYTWGGGRDFEALKRLMAQHADPVILLRWERGLLAEGWLHTSTIAQLALKFNDLAKSQTAPQGASSDVYDPEKQRARIAAQLAEFEPRPIRMVPRKPEPQEKENTHDDP